MSDSTSTQTHSSTPTARELRSRLRSLPAGNGWLWIKAGWELFKLSPLQACVASLLLILVPLLGLIIPQVGSLISTLLAPTIAAGTFLLWEGLQRTGKLKLEDILGGFNLEFKNLFLVGLLNFAAMMVIGLASLVVTVLIGFLLLDFSKEGFTELLQQASALLTANDMSTLLTALSSPIFLLLAFGGTLAMGLAVPLLMAQAFSPAFVVFHRMGPVEAMKASFYACLANVWPFLIYGIALIPIYTLSLIPLGLGIFVANAVLSASTYYAFTDILGEIPKRN